MSVYCHILADGRMRTTGGVPIVHEFAASPRIGEKIVIMMDEGARAFRVTDVTNYAKGVEGEAQVLLVVPGAS